MAQALSGDAQVSPMLPGNSKKKEFMSNINANGIITLFCQRRRRLARPRPWELGGTYDPTMQQRGCRAAQAYLLRPWCRWLRRCGSNGLTGASEGDRPTAEARVKLGLRLGHCIPLQPFLLAQNPGYKRVGQALRFCLSDLVRMKSVPARPRGRTTSASTLASRRSIRKALGFMGAGPLARSACPLMGNPVGNLVHTALELL